jgi:hypothetical protein
VLAEHPLGGVEDLRPVLGPPGGTPPGAGIGLRLGPGRALAG